MKKYIFLAFALLLSSTTFAWQEVIVENWQDGIDYDDWYVPPAPPFVKVFNSIDIQDGETGCVAQSGGTRSKYLWMDSKTPGVEVSNVIKTKFDFSDADPGNFVVSFDTIETSDSPAYCSTLHYGLNGDPNCDGAYFSCDGYAWHRFWQAPTRLDSWTTITANLSGHTSMCDEINESFAIKFMQHGTEPCTDDGMGYDNIRFEYDKYNWMEIYVVVNTDNYTVSNAEIDEFIDNANLFLSFQSDNIRMRPNAVDQESVPTTSDALTLLHDRLIAGYDPPQAMVFFVGDEATVYSGGMSWDVGISGIPGVDYCNPFVSIYGTTIGVYSGRIDWSHRANPCGYNMTKYHETLEWDHISSVSLADGTCGGTPGISCIWSDQVEHYVCENKYDEVNPLYRARISNVASSFAHEVLHSFGTHGYLDHWGTSTCDTMMGGTDYRMPYDPIQSQYYVNMCPYIWDNLEDSYDAYACSS